jgi:EAL domain-containing protein (putative c-di-GMP-specific phosphodiesterase class I)
MTTTAEGVETQEQLDALRALGCTQMEGYLFSAAVSAPEIRKLLFPDAAKVRQIKPKASYLPLSRQL